MKLHIQDGLPYVTATLTYQGQELSLENVLLDTGSAGVIFSTDRVLEIGLHYAPEDAVHRIRGVGGAEFVLPSALTASPLVNWTAIISKSKSAQWTMAFR
jgi:hypothetical protein